MGRNPTSRSLLPQQPLQPKIQRLTAHLPREHQADFYLTRRPQEDDVGCT